MSTTKRKRKGWFRRTNPMVAAGLFALSGLFVGTALAVHDLNLLELDENATDEGGAYDWENVWCDAVDPEDPNNLGFRLGNEPDCSTVPFAGALVQTWGIDPVNDINDDIMAGGKDSLNPVCTLADPNACSDWGWKLGASNDKNDIEHGMAVIDEAANGDKILYAALDKLSNNGSASATIWVFQERVEQLGTGESESPFSIGHVGPGDIALQTDFTNGGEISRLQAYIWDDGIDGFNGFSTDAVRFSHGDLERIDDLAFVELDGNGDPIVDCDEIGNGDNLCAQVNQQDEIAPWDYEYKFSGGVAPSSVFPTATFFEVGINLTALFGEDIPCFSTIGFFTRQSASETAELEDKQLINFDTCETTAVTKVFVDDDPDIQIFPSVAPRNGVVFVGEEIYDMATLTGINFLGGAPDPTSPPDGVFKLYDNGTCDAGGAGEPNVLMSWSESLAVGTPDDGISTAMTSTNYTVLIGDVGNMSFGFEWDGNVDYPAGAVADCEPFVVQQPFLTINKICTNDCAVENGLFDLKIGTTVVGDETACGGGTGAIPVAPGTHIVSETADGETDLDDYASIIGGDCASNGSVTLSGNQSKTCSIENVRRPTLTIVKQVENDTSGQEFDLKVGGVLATGAAGTALDSVATMESGDGDDVGDGGTVTVRIETAYNSGSGVFAGVSVSEAFDDDSAVTNYTTLIQCDDFAGPTSTTPTGTSVSIPSFLPGETVTCTIINIADEGAACSPPS